MPRRPEREGPASSRQPASLDAPEGAHLSGDVAPKVVVGAREGLLAALALSALLAAAYANVVFLERSLVYSNNYNPIDYRSLPQNYGPRAVPPGAWLDRGLLLYANFHDPGGAWWQWEPSSVYLHNGLLEKDWPFWDPYVAAGAPAMSNLIPTFFFPPYFLVVALGNTVLLKNAYFLGLLLATGWFTYAVLRRSGMSPLSSYLGGAAWMLSGGISQNVGSFIGQALCCAPLVVWATQRFLARATWRRGVVLAACFAGVALASFPPVLLPVFGLALLLVGLGVAAAARSSRQEARRVAFRFLVSGALAVGLVAFYYLPAFSAMADAPQVRVAYAGAGSQTVSPYQLWQLLAPGVLGGREILARPSVAEPTNATIPYVGVVPFLLALVGVTATARREARLLKTAALLTTALVLLKLLGIPPVQWIGLLPGFSSIHFAHYLPMFLGFPLALLAALGLEALLSGGTGRVRLAASLGVGLVFALTLRAVIRVFEKPDVAVTTWLSNWRFALLAAGLATVLCVLSQASSRTSWARASCAALLLLLVVEGVRNTYYPRQTRWDIWRQPSPYIERLSSIANGNRVFASRGVFRANAGSAFEIFGLDSLMAFNPPRIFELYRRYANPDTPLFLRQASKIPPEGVLDRANVSVLALYAGSPELIREARARGYEDRWADGYVRLLWRRSSPRYFFTSEYHVLAPPEALEAIGVLPPGRDIVLETRPGCARVSNAEADPLVRVVRFRRGSVTLEVEAPRPGLVYCSESDFPGWTARVEGKRAPILTANYAFRAVEVPAGHSRVELTYLPPGLVAGIVISAASAALLLGLAGRRFRT